MMFDKDKLDNQIYKLYNEVVHVNSHLRLLLDMENFLFENEYYKDVHDISPAFWKMVSISTFNNILISLARFCDETRDVFSVKVMIDKIENNKKSYFNDEQMHEYYKCRKYQEIKPDELIEKAKKYYESTLTIRGKLKKYRNKILAHSDYASYTETNELLKHLPISVYEMNFLIDKIFLIIDLFIEAGLNNKIKVDENSKKNNCCVYDNLDLERLMISVQTDADRRKK